MVSTSDAKNCAGVSLVSPSFSLSEFGERETGSDGEQSVKACAEKYKQQWAQLHTD